MFLHHKTTLGFVQNIFATSEATPQVTSHFQATLHCPIRRSDHTLFRSIKAVLIQVRLGVVHTYYGVLVAP